MIGKKINQLATELAPVSTDLTIIGDPTTGVSKKITLAQLGAIFSGAVSFYTNLAGFPTTGDINVIYCAKDTQKLYLWSGSAYVEVFPSQALLDTYQLRSEKGVSNGYASLDSSGKVPISQLPSSIMEYKGTWNAATNTPTLANGTGDTGDVYICNVAGTVDFGAGPITFAVGDYVIYSGSIWQRSSGAVGTVTSVAATITGDAIGITGSPVTTSGTLAFAFAGTSSQYINGAGNLTTFPSLTGYVPYTGATANVDLGTFDLTADILTAATGSYTSSGGGNTLEISHTSGSGIALNITKGGNGEGLYINKTSGTGNAATIVGTLEATTLVKTGGTSSQFLKADGSVDSSTYLTTSAAATTYLPMVLSSTANSIEINGQFFDVASAANSYTSGRLIIAPTYGAIGYQNAGVFDGLKILTNGNAEFSNSGITRFFNQVRFDSTLTNGTYTYTLPGATGTLALTSDLTGGTVTSVGLSSATSGVTIGSTPITTSGTITLAIATASGSQQGLLSSTDWTTFNNKQNALTNPVTGTGTTNYLPKFTGTSTIGNSIVQDDGSTLTIGGALSGRNATFTSSTANIGIIGTGTFSYLQLGHNGGATNYSYLVATSDGVLDIESNTVKFTDYSGASERMRINASGNVSIGNTNDTYKLDVSGTGRFTSSVTTTQLISLSASGSAALFLKDGSANNKWEIGHITNSLYFYNYTRGGNDLILNGSTGAATFSSSVTANRYILNGSNGNSGQIIQQGDLFSTAATNFLIQASSGNGIGFLVNGGSTFNMFINSTGNVGIGTTSPGSYLLALNTSASQGINLNGTGTGGSWFLFSNSGTANGYIASAYHVFLGGSQTDFAVRAENNLCFGTGATERMRISSGGSVRVGTTGLTVGARLELKGAASASAMSIDIGTNGYPAISFQNESGSQQGYIVTNSSSVQYLSISDYRLKNDFKDYSGLDLVSKIKTYNYEWKADKTRAYGVIAHELQSVINYAVYGVKDGEQMQGVDYSKIVPVLIKAIQEQQQQIEQLKNK